MAKQTDRNCYGDMKNETLAMKASKSYCTYCFSCLSINFYIYVYDYLLMTSSHYWLFNEYITTVDPIKLK